LTTVCLQHNANKLYQWTQNWELALYLFIPTFFLIVAKMSLPKRSASYWLVQPIIFNFLTLGHSGGLDQ